jgi:hypothetical protein
MYALMCIYNCIKESLIIYLWSVPLITHIDLKLLRNTSAHPGATTGARTTRAT